MTIRARKQDAADAGFANSFWVSDPSEKSNRLKVSPSQKDQVNLALNFEPFNLSQIIFLGPILDFEGAIFLAYRLSGVLGFRDTSVFGRSRP